MTESRTSADEKAPPFFPRFSDRKLADDAPSSPQELAADTVLVVMMLKNDRIFTCLLRPDTSTFGTVRCINSLRSYG